MSPYHLHIYLQADQTSHVVDNIHGIFAAAASQFTVDQFTAFTQLLTNNWYKEKDAMKEKHIALLGQIGKETKNHELAQKVCTGFKLNTSQHFLRFFVSNATTLYMHCYIQKTPQFFMVKKAYTFYTIYCY